jgi:hypothetical protein
MLYQLVVQFEIMLTATVDSYVINTLMRDLIGHDHRPAAFVVYLWLAVEQQRRCEAVTISYAELAEETGLSRSATQMAVHWLLQRRLVASDHASATSTPVYTTLKPWKRGKG